MSEDQCLEQRRYEKEFQYFKIYVHNNFFLQVLPGQNMKICTRGTTLG